MAHPTEDALERFVMKKPADGEVEEVECHILGCQDCLNRVMELESFIQACRDAIPAFQQEQALLSATIGAAKWLGWLGLTSPKWAWAPTLAAVALLVVLFPTLHQPRQTRFDASLSASRGVEGGPVLPQRIPVLLHLDANDLPAGLKQVELVDGEGRPVWSGAARVHANQVTVETPRLETGTYFVRLYPAQEGHANPNRLLREFVFQVR